MKRIVAIALALCLSFGMIVSVSAANPFARRLNLVRLIRSMFNAEEAEEEVAEEKPVSTLDTTRDPATVYDRVVIVGIDGAGSFIRKADMPKFDAIFEDSALIYRAKAVGPIAHAESWASILTGVTPEYHWVNMNAMDSGYHYYGESDYPTIFRVTREAYPDAKIASFATWADLNVALIEENINVYTDTADNDAALSEKVVDYINKNDPKLLFVELDDVVKVAETSDYGMLEHIAKLEETDQYIEDIYNALEAKGYAENTLFIVTTDHGGSGKYCLDDTKSVVYNCTFAAKGKTVDSEFDSKDMLTLDIAAIVAYALGINQPEGWTAMVPDGLFKGYTAGERPEGIPPYDLENTEMADDIDTTELYEDDGSDLYDRVIVIGVDGAGQFRNADIPYINKIMEDGAVTFNARTVRPSISTQAWTAMFHGVTPDIHGETNSTNGDPYDPDSLYPSFMRVVREAEPDAKLASFVTWEKINIGIVEENIGVHKETAENDIELLGKILSYLDKNDPRILYVQFDNVDGLGHDTGFGSQLYWGQVGTTDEYIGQIYKKLAERDLLKNTLIIVTADHGGTADGNHGGPSEGEMTIMYAVAGKTVVKGGQITSLDKFGNAQSPEITDTAAIVLHALGYDAPESWTSTVPGDLFEGVEATVRPEHTVDYQVDHRDNESAEAPAAGITSAISADRIIAYSSLDEDAEILAEGIEYVPGFYGEAAKLDNGSVEFADFRPGTDSFSIGFWFKTPIHKFDEDIKDPCVFANKTWNGIDQGMVLHIDSERNGSTDHLEFSLIFNFANGSDEMNVPFYLPSDWQDGWVYVLLSVDREAGTVGVSYDFGAFETAQIPEALKNVTMDGEGGLIFGQDSTKEYLSMPATVDDVVIISGAVTDEDVSALKAYYGIK